MAPGVWKSFPVIGVSVITLILVSAACVHVFWTGHLVEDGNGDSASEKTLRRAIDTSTEQHTYYDTAYSKSELAKFAYKHRDEIAEAPKQRATECGSVVSVSPIDCDVCIILVDGLVQLVERGSTQEDVTEFITRACIDLKIMDKTVCHSVVQEYKDMVLSVLINIGYKPEEVCAMALGPQCPGIPWNPMMMWNVTFPDTPKPPVVPPKPPKLEEVCAMALGPRCPGIPWNPMMMWNVTFPDTPKPPVIPPKPPKAGSPTMRVLHLTDFHFDTEYMEGYKAECGEPLCCRLEDGLPAPGNTGAGRYGDYRNCDTSQRALDSLFRHLNATQDQFDYVIFTGDIPPHNVWNQSRPQQLDALQNYIFYMKSYLPDKLVLNAMGNHESAPCNSFPPPYVTGNFSEEWLYDAVVPAWRNWLPPDTEATIKFGGFYSHSPFPGLRVISLNMNFCASLNWWLFINATDPAGMLQWFVTELQAAEDKDEKVHVLGHVYPGNCMKPFSWNYYKIVNRYENTIAGQFFGHSHLNYYEMFYDEETLKRPLAVAYIPGSITTYNHLNPGYRIYNMDGNYAGSSWRVQDYTNYFLNITDANMSNKPVWRKEYSAKDEYGLENLFPEDWNQLIYRMRADDALYAKFCKHRVKMGPNNCDACHGVYCKLEELCQLKTGRSGDPALCNDLE